MPTRGHLCLLAALILALPLAALAQPSATITGTMTDAATGNPLSALQGQGFVVVACGPGGGCAVSGSTDASGRYTIAGLPPGVYHLRTINPRSYVAEVFDGTPCIAADCALLSSGTPVTLIAGQTSVVDFALAPAGHIAGVVTNAATGVPIPSARVSALDTWSGLTVAAFTDAGGAYDIDGLPTGAYALMFDAFGFKPEIAPGLPCLRDDCRIASATPVAVTAGQTTTQNEALSPVPPRGAVAGRITDGTQGLAQVNVFASAPGMPGAGTTTDGTGAFRIDGVAPGRYTVRTAVPLASALFDRSADVVVAEGATTTVEFVLATGASISGRLVAPPGETVTLGVASHGFAALASVAAFDTAGRFVKSAELFDGDPAASSPPRYVLRGLAPGRYYLRYDDAFLFFPDSEPLGGKYMTQIVGSGTCVADTCDVTRGRPFDVRADESVTGLDIPLVPAGSIQVIDGDPGLQYELYDARGVRLTHLPEIIATGTRPVKFFPALPAGIYYVRQVGDRRCPECPVTSGRPIEVRPPERTIVTLTEVPPARHVVSGTVREASTLAPLGAIAVVAFDANGAAVSSARTDVFGRFELPGVDARTIFLETQNSRGYVDRLYHAIDCGACEPREGTPVTVDGDVTGIDFELQRAGLVAAAVSDEHDGVVAGIPVTYLDATRRPLARITTGSHGVAYGNLAPGAYFVRTEPVHGRIMELFGVGACASGACDVSTGTQVAVSLTGMSTIALTAATCSAPEVSPGLLASGVVGRPYRQVLHSSHPSSGFLTTNGRLPAGLTLDRSTGALSGAPVESGTFAIDVAAVDGTGCAGISHFSLQVAQCAFALVPSDATVGADGAELTVTASDACGFTSVDSRDPWVATDLADVGSGASLHVTVAPNAGDAPRFSAVTVGRRVFSIRQSGRVATSPSGSLDAPADGAQVTGSVAVSGWALDDLEVRRVRIYREPVGDETQPLVFIGDAVFVEGARPDVEQAFPSLPFRTRAGWGYLLLTNMLPNHGNGTFVLHAMAEDAEGQTKELGTRTIVAANTFATKPFGAIDTPAQGQVISGSSFVNFGWALTPAPKSIPTDGHTMQVLIDGVPAGSPSYNFFRSDVSGLFPGLANSGGPVGFRFIDTAALSEGAHTIAWIVTDSAGVTEGIGSRYFTVRNSADAPVAGLAAGADLGRASASLPDASAGARSIHISSLSHVTLDARTGLAASCVASYAAYLVVDGELRDLPVGATLEPDGRLSWQPGPAFHGRYRFAVVRTDCQGRKTTMPVVVTVR